MTQSDDKKYQRHINQQNDQEMKEFLSSKKKEYKQRKEQLKEVIMNLSELHCKTIAILRSFLPCNQDCSKMLNFSSFCMVAFLLFWRDHFLISREICVWIT